MKAPGRCENVAGVPVRSGGRCDDDVRGVGRLVVEGDVSPRVEGDLEFAALLGGVGEDVLAFADKVPALVACLDHRLHAYPVRVGPGCAAAGGPFGAPPNWSTTSSPR